MTKTTVYSCAVLLLISLVPLVAAEMPAGQTAPRPNIILILADDLGWTDLGVMGSRYYETPHIDRLAARGVMLTSFYASQSCRPTRAALMSGQYAPRTGVYSTGKLSPEKGSLVQTLKPPQNTGKLPLDKLTIAQLLKRSGYATGMFGKWHLGRHDEYHPAKRGFDEALVTGWRYTNFRVPPPYVVEPDAYLTDYLTDRALNFVREHKDRPFFLYLPHLAPHGPLDAKPELTERFKAKKPDGGHHNPVYAAMIYSLDQSVGRIVDEIERLDLSERTLVIFTSDNGGYGGYDVPGTTRRVGVTDNHPLRGGKSTLNEGGIRVPLIARWAGRIEAGSRSDTPAIHVDLFPTFLELAGVSRPDGHALDGESLVPILLDPGSGLQRDAIYWHVPGYSEIHVPEPAWGITPVSIIRSGQFKLFEFLEDGRLELYDLKRDAGERHDLAAELPDRTAQLQASLAAWRQSIGAAMPER